MKYSVKVIANASRDKVEFIDETHIKMHIVATPEKGKANKHIIKLDIIFLQQLDLFFYLLLGYPQLHLYLYSLFSPMKYKLLPANFVDCHQG